MLELLKGFIESKNSNTPAIAYHDREWVMGSNATPKRNCACFDRIVPLPGFLRPIDGHYYVTELRQQ